MVPDAYVSATKIKRIFDHVEGAREKAARGEVLFGTVDTWLIWKLTGGKVHVTDYTNASRTMLFDIKRLCWDETLLKALDIPAACLPEVRNSSDIYGHVNIQERDIPIAGIAGDQQAALFGQCCFDSGDIKNTYGTGCFLLMNTGPKPAESKNGLLTTIAIGLKDGIQYALEGSVFVGGAVIQWIRDEMRFIDESRDAEYYAQKVSDTGGVYLVPAFTGLGAPYWDMYARGSIVGITRGTKRNHIIRAAQEAIAYQVMDMLRAMEKDLNVTNISLRRESGEFNRTEPHCGYAISELKVDGGASRDKFLMQFQADICGAEIIRPVVRETTALGAACLAGITVGFWKDISEIKNRWKKDALFSPDMENSRRENLISGWHKAVESCRTYQ
jgi:glycerol kinase